MTGSEDDPGRTESQQVSPSQPCWTKKTHQIRRAMLGLMQTLKATAKSKKNTFIKDFRKEVKAEQQRLRELLQQKEDEAAKASADHSALVQRSVNAALTPPTASNDKGKARATPVATTDPTKHPFFFASQRALDQSQALIADYHNLADLVDQATEKQNERTGFMQGCQKDKEKVERLLEIGKRVAAKKINRVLAAAGEEETEDRVWESLEANERLEAGLYFKDNEKRREEKELSLGEMLRGAEKGVLRMVKVLPE
ncbi:hypothetical protein LTS18_012271 [Coniosporium uncinatum]|uniref:Uncharacterized protein n=1 Tax=Coniosporium uncinatum TaxID=93489 RepID=A0ACC3CXY4_9PEZI|nr:hypothetical protein LTS18_012271 [Coniosporium uncinatum]